MKKYLKNNDGMALAMVLVIMTICMILASAMAVFAYNSFMSVRWMNDEKRAYFLSRAGVEAASYSYQNAVMKTSSNYDNLANFAEFTDIDKFVAIGEDGNAIITTNKVYLVYSASGANEGSPMDGLEFKTYASDEAAQADPNCIGYFEVEIGDGTDVVSVNDGQGNTIDQETDVKVFKSRAVCNEKVQTSFGYITAMENVVANELYNDDGFLSTEGITKEQSGQPGNAGKFIKTDKYINYDTDITDAGDGFFTRIFKGIIKTVFSWITESDGRKGRDISVFVKQSDANLVLAKPKNSKFIKTNDNKDNFYVFATTADLFLKDVGLQVTPTKWNYASIGLYGDEIVVDGDITMEVYYTNPDSLLGDKLGSTIEMLGKRFRLGTVVLGDASVIGTPRQDPVPKSAGGLSYKGKPVPANKVYFNGNVYVKIYTQGGSTETYRVFTAGDMAYFYGGYRIKGVANNDSYEAQGIDLLKYFVDAVLAEKDGHLYGDSLKRKMAKVSELYYGGLDNSYFANDDVLIRKIDVQYENNGDIVVDNGFGDVSDIIQPSPVDATTITWGKPKGTNVFD